MGQVGYQEMSINELAWLLVAEAEMYFNQKNDNPSNFPWITHKHWAREKGYLQDVSW